ncbi:MAG: hypothetical protein L0Z55_07420 [Planctomycetes bacterium]|nr:hypothetical protein [Planctomycetota bacterium]
MRGAPHVEPVHISPGAKRVVQFYPYIQNATENWTLALPDGSEISIAYSAKPEESGACVLLAGEAPRERIRCPLRAFPAAWMPRAIGALDGLAAVALDHSPVWDRDQERAFLAWLETGGALFLLQDDTEEFPRFEGALAALNVEPERQRYGFGRVFRRYHGARDLREDEVLAFRERDGDFGSLGAARRAMLDSEIVQELKSLTKPSHRWDLILALLLIYGFLVTGWAWRIGRKYRDYRISLWFVLGCVVLFSGIFYLAARGGFASTAQIDSLVYAAVSPAGTRDVTQWGQFFAADAGDYSISFPESPSNITTIHRTETVSGGILPAQGGTLALRMPLYSHREFLRRGLIEGAPMFGAVPRAARSRRISGMRIPIEKGFPKSVTGIFAWDGLRLHRGKRMGDEVEFGPGEEWERREFRSPYLYAPREAGQDRARWCDALAFNAIGGGLLSRLHLAGQASGAAVVDVFVFSRDAAELAGAPSGTLASGTVVYHQLLSFDGE